MPAFSRFVRDKGGNVALMFALALVPVFGAVGAAVDYGRVADVRAKLAAALDAGVLAVGSQSTMTQKQAFATVENWVDVHMGPDYAPYWHLDSVTQDDDGNITAVASGTVDTTIARVLGINSVDINVTSEAVRSIGKVELALVLDNTGSMQKNDKIGKLREAATSLVDSLANATKDPKDLRISLVPFSQTVNVGSTYKTASWIDAAGNSKAAKSLFLGQKVNRFDLFTKLGKSWGGCVETRAAAYEATETVNGKDADSLYVPYFAPDEPGKKGATGGKVYANSYLDDSSMKVIEAALDLLGLSDVLELPDFMLLQGDITKYKGTPKSGANGENPMKYEWGPNSGCEIAPLMRLSSDTKAVNKAISKMVANGNTDIPIGLTWGWNTLSPVGPFGDGNKYGSDEWTKFVVLMTDGNNQNAAGNQEDESLYSGVGYIWQGRMGIDKGNEAARTKARDARLGEICKTMRDEGIIIFTVRVEVKGSSSPVLENCGQAPGKFYEVDNASQLNAVFADIGGSIQKLRLAH